MEQVQVLLDSRLFLYKLLQNFFGNQPTEDMMDIICDKLTLEVIELYRTEVSNSAITELSDFIAQYKINKHEILEKIKSEYTRLFIGPAKLPVPLWESVYISGDHVIFDKHTLAVREIYRDSGFLPAEYPHVADDHLALELDYMLILAEKLSKAYDCEDQRVAMETMSLSKNFLNDHLLKWVPQFASRLSKLPNTEFYPILSAFAEEFLRIDYETISELLQTY